MTKATVLAIALAIGLLIPFVHGCIATYRLIAPARTETHDEE